jgi:hypothetical protein
MKYLIWDFSGTLGCRKGGNWSAVLQEILAREAPDCEVETDRIGAFL